MPRVINPTAGLTQGQQLALYAGTSPSSADRTRSPAPHDPAPYSLLADWLRGQAADRITARFADLEAALGRPLPPSARRHRPWRANTDHSPQTRAWLGAGWRVAAVGLACEQSPSNGQGIRMAHVVYRSEVRIEPLKGAVRAAYLPSDHKPVLYGIHGAVAEHYGLVPDGHATTLDHIVAAAAG